MLVHCIWSEWTCWIGWWGNYILYTTNFDYIRSMSTTSTFTIDYILQMRNRRILFIDLAAKQQRFLILFSQFVILGSLFLLFPVFLQSWREKLRKCLPVICMYGATFKSSNCMLNKSRFIQGVSMDVDLHFKSHNHLLTSKSWLNLQTLKGTSTWISYWSATDRHISIAAGVVPQSSWSFSPIAPALIISCRPSALELLPCNHRRNQDSQGAHHYL